MSKKVELKNETANGTKPLLDAVFGNSEEEIFKLKDESVDIICIDPPYLYLKNQKLERVFDEQLFFEECKRVLQKDGFIILFGRGSSFYRWNNILDNLGFAFKEEIIWDKSQCSSPLMNLSRVHETISIHTKGSGTINKVKVPYIEMKRHDIGSIIQDIKRLKSVFTQPKSLDAVNEFLEKNKRDVSDSWEKNNLSISSNITKEDRSVSVLRSVKDGMNEKSIIRTDMQAPSNPRKGVTCEAMKPTGDRCVNVVQSVEFGMNEKSIIKQVRDHYKSIHPTQKPVKLIERLIQLCLPNKPRNEILVADFFAGSFSCGEACYNLGVNFRGYEIDIEYFDSGCERLKKIQYQTRMF
jgi:site-specific DNA-methyltransferase (adenine-specific)